MYSTKLTVGQAMARLKQKNQVSRKEELAFALKTSTSTYLKIERDQRNLSLIMAVRLCEFYDIEINDFIAMLADHELERADIPSLKAISKRKRRIE